MKFNVSLDKEQLEEIANITADKVLDTVKYQRNHEEWDKREIEELKEKIKQRDSKLVQQDFLIDRLRDNLRKMRDKVKELKGE